MMTSYYGVVVMVKLIKSKEYKLVDPLNLTDNVVWQGYDFDIDVLRDLMMLS